VCSDCGIGKRGLFSFRAELHSSTAGSYGFRVKLALGALWIAQTFAMFHIVGAFASSGWSFFYRCMLKEVARIMEALLSIVHFSNS